MRVLKVASKQRINLEAIFYKLLQTYNLPTIASERLNSNVLSLEDLTISDKWRLATEKDINKADIGLACSNWYHGFHQAAKAEVKKNPTLFNDLNWEYDFLNEENLVHAGTVFSITNLPIWNKAVSLAPRIIACLRPKIDTLTYNDFNYVNLAISTENGAVITMYDFDHSGKGIQESDYRNVSSGLQGSALASFTNSIFPDEVLSSCDEVLSLLYGLVIASHRKQMPKWATNLRDSVMSKKFLLLIEGIESTILP